MTTKPTADRLRMLDQALERGYLVSRRGPLRSRFIRMSLDQQGFYVYVAPRIRYASIDADSRLEQDRLSDVGRAAAMDALRPYQAAAYQAGYKGWGACGTLGVTPVLLKDADEAAAKLVALYRDQAMRRMSVAS